jgi:uncharacterized repeat protein (TIGR02543 family)
VEINATWIAHEYTVTFYIDNVFFSEVTGPVGTPLSAPEIYPPTGYSFAGWDIEIPTEIPANNLDIHGSYTANSYTLSFYIDGVLLTAITAEYDSPITAPTPPAVTGKNFVSWSAEVPERMPAENMNINGIYEFIDYTVSFYVLGELVDSFTFHYGDSITPPVIPDVPGRYTFLGWAPAIPEAMPAEDCSFGAVIEIEKATVAFDLNGGTGTVPAEINDEIGTLIELPAQGDITREGYVFLGWATTPDAVQALESFEIPMYGQTLYAVWQPAALPEIIELEGSTAVVDNDNGFIYGLSQGITEAAIMNYIGCTGNARIEFEYSFTMGTGTAVKLIDNSTGEVLATYYIVIFGDIDGDGSISSSDCSQLLNAVAYNVDLPVGSAYYYAANIDGADGLSAIDASNLLNAVAFNISINQATGTTEV